MTFTVPQLILIFGLSGLLLAWLGVFAWLAFRPEPGSHDEDMEQTASPAIIAPTVIRTLPITPLTPLSSGIRTITPITSQKPIMTVSADVPHDMALEHTTH